MQYKTVAAPTAITVGKRDSNAEAVQQYAEIIRREATGGWRLILIQEIPVVQKNGCIAALLGNGTTTTMFNMLVFERDD